MTALLHGAAAVGLLLLSALCGAQPTQVRVGVVTDGPTDREMFSAAMIEREIANVVAGDLDIVMPAAKRYVADWSANGVSTALNRALADPQVDIVLTLGVLASNEAAHREHLPKPVIAPLVVDPVLQHFPLAAGASGRKNFTYVADFQGVEADVQAFHRVVKFKHIVALVDATLLRALPELAGKASQIQAALAARVSVVPVDSDPQAALAAIPADADAVFVGGLLRFDAVDMHELAQGLVTRRLPSFSIMGRSELRDGILMSCGGAQRDSERLARRVVLMIQRLMLGEDAASFEVGFPTQQRLMINMRTARQIGFSPRWQDLADAEQLDAEPADAAESLSLLDAMRAALSSNPQLAASRAHLDSSADDIRIARSSLLPALDASAAQTRIDADRASPLTQAEKTSSANLSFQQVVYSERAWANYSISQSLYEASQQGHRQDTLDTLQSAASAYLDVLRAKSVESVRRANVENTRQNLETARVRESVGLGGRSDHLRWQAQLARDKQSLLAAESTRRQAETELARIIHRPANRPFATVESGLDDPLRLVSSARLQTLLDTPAKWAVFSDYAVDAALKSAPEIAQTDAIVASRVRAVTAARRAYYVPDIALVSNGSRTLEKRGAGSSAAPGAPDDESWSVSLQFSIPVFTGRRRSAELSQARHELRASEADRATATDAIEARARVNLHRAGSSYPSIELSTQAAAAANENLSMVTDAYARGAVSITDLIDAQDTALSSDLAAADAKYTFLTDFVAVLRATNEFDILLDPWSREAWLKRVEDWFRDHASAAQL